MPRKSIVIRDSVSPRLMLLQGNIQIALADGVTESLSIATNKIRRRVITATTKTGKMRVAGIKPRFKVRPAWYLGNGPGRVESGKMLASARYQVNEKNGKVTGRGGFLKAPNYLELQELGNGKIEPMLAYQMGLTTFEARFPATMNRKLNSAVGNASLGRAMKRSALGYE